MKPADLLNDPAYVALLGTISDARVAKQYGISRNTVLDHRTRLGIKPARNHAPISDQARLKMDKMLREGTWTYPQIAQGCHVHVTTVQLRARDLGIDRTEKARKFFHMIARHEGGL